MPLKRFDCDGRDVTELPSLWSDTDATPYGKAVAEIARLGRCNDQLSRTCNEIVKLILDEVERITKERDDARDAARVIWAASIAAFELLDGISPKTVADVENKWTWIKKGGEK